MPGSQTQVRRTHPQIQTQARRTSEIELAAFSLLGGAYLAARANDLDLPAAAVATALAGALLVLAASCEAGLWLA